MTQLQTWAIRPKWHRYESPRSYAQRQCSASGVPFDLFERGLTSRRQPNIHRVWIDQKAAAKTVEAGAGRPQGHFDRLLTIAQPQPQQAYPARYLCRLCSSGETIEQVPHDRENWCLKHPGQLVWVGPDTTPLSQQIIAFDGALRKAELTFRRLVAAKRIDTRLHAQVWAMVRDNSSLTRSADRTNSAAPPSRAALFIETVQVLQVLSSPDTIELWRTLTPTELRRHIAQSLCKISEPHETLIERVVLWLRPHRRVVVPTRINPLEMPLDLLDASKIIDVRAPYPNWIKRHPRAISEWDWRRNAADRDPWDPKDVSKKAWWICDEGHSWEAIPNVRGQAGCDCPFCALRNVWRGQNDLETLHPELAVEWDITHGVNPGGPSYASATSSRRVTWKCPQGHGWVAPIRQRVVKGTGCPYCVGVVAIPGETDLATRSPDVAAEWDAELNAPLTPQSVTRGANKLVWWRGSRCGHSWRTTVAARTRGHGCPYCANKKVLAGFNDLETSHPHLVAEWSDENVKGTHQMIAGSNHRASWGCSAGHKWKAIIKSRALGGSRCPICTNRAVLADTNDLAHTHPQLAAEWDSRAGVNDRSPEQVTSGSGYRAGWVCARQHRWSARVHARVSGSGCPFCRGVRILAGENDLATLRPDLALEWDASNGAAPEEVGLFETRKRQWRCAQGHSWATSVSNRKRGGACPFCQGRRAIPGQTDLASLRPDLAANWDPSNSRPISEVTAGSGYRAHWICDSGHSWSAQVSARTSKRGSGCPYCSGRRAIPAEPDLTT